MEAENLELFVRFIKNISSFDRLELKRSRDVIKALCMIHWELIKKQLHLDTIRFLGWEAS